MKIGDKIEINKEDREFFDVFKTGIEKGSVLMAEGASLRVKNQKLLFENINLRYPETKGLMLNYDWEKRVITILGKESWFGKRS